MRFFIETLFAYLLLVLFNALENSASIRYNQLSPYSPQFVSVYDYADAESYASDLFINLIEHMNKVKNEKDKCSNIPLPKTVLTQRYFNPTYEFLRYKPWFPPKDHQHVVFWSQKESYRSSLFLSYLLQYENGKFPPGLFNLEQMLNSVV